MEESNCTAEPKLTAVTSSETAAPPSPEPRAPEHEKQTFSIRRSTYESDMKDNDNSTHGVFHAIDSTSKQPTIHLWLQYIQLGEMGANHFRAKNYDTFHFTPYSSKDNWNKANPEMAIVAEIKRKGEGAKPASNSNNKQGFIDDLIDVVFSGSYLSITIKVLLVIYSIYVTTTIGVRIGFEFQNSRLGVEKETKETYTGKGWFTDYEQKCAATDNNELGLREKTARLFGESKKSDEEHAKALISWLEREGGYFHPNLQMRRVDPSDPTSFFGMFVNDFIPEGELLLRVPRSMVLDSTEEEPERDIMTCATVRNLVNQLKLKDDSKYAPYVNYLMDTQPPGCISAWSKAGKDLFTQVTSPSDPLDWVDKLSPPQWSEVGKNFISSVTGTPKKIVDELPPYTPFKWTDVWRDTCEGSDDPLEEYAALIAIQRSWDDKMIPVFDMMSHGNGHWLNTVHSNVHDTDIDVSVYSSRDIRANEQIHTSYNRCDSCGNRKYEYGTDLIMREYGFVEQMPQSFYLWQIGMFGYRLDKNTSVSGKGKGYGKVFVTEWIYREPTEEEVEEMEKMLKQIEITKVTHLSKQCNVDDVEWETINNYVKALEDGLKAAVRAARKEEGVEEIEVIGQEELEEEDDDEEEDEDSSDDVDDESDSGDEL